MEKNARKALILWLATALSIVGFVIGFNVAVDPFGYFGQNTVGYYFSSERQFKYSLVKSADYNALVLGDSRIAFTDPKYMSPSQYKFVNGGIGGASLRELVALLSESRLDRLELVVFGLLFGDLSGCEEDARPAGTAGPPEELGPWDPLRFAASWSQFTYAVEALRARSQGRSPQYHADGTRSVVSEHLRESMLDEKTETYWKKIKRNLPDEPRAAPSYEFGAKCRELLREARKLADRHGFKLMVVFVPRNRDLIELLNLETPEAREETEHFLAEVNEVVPYVVDLSDSTFSDSRNFWLDDSMHFKPETGALALQEAITRSIGVQARN